MLKKILPFTGNMIGDRIKSSLILLCLVGMIGSLNANAPDDVIKDSQTKVSVTLIGYKGLLAVPIMRNEFMPSPIMGVGVSYDGKVYVTETTRQQREEISLIQSPFLHEKDMELISTKTKRDWIIKNYSPTSEYLCPGSHTTRLPVHAPLLQPFYYGPT